jgi:hypothetical protein
MGGCLLPNLSTPWPLLYAKTQQNLSLPPKKKKTLSRACDDSQEMCEKTLIIMPCTVSRFLLDMQGKPLLIDFGLKILAKDLAHPKRYNSL